MTDAPRTMDEALAENDVTLAMTPGQLLLFVIAVFVVVRLIRKLRG